MTRLTAELKKLRVDGAKLDRQIRRNLEGIGCGK
jgi:hypothetical protein